MIETLYSSHNHFSSIGRGILWTANSKNLNGTKCPTVSRGKKITKTFEIEQLRVKQPRWDNQTEGLVYLGLAFFEDLDKLVLGFLNLEPDRKVLKLGLSLSKVIGKPADRCL